MSRESTEDLFSRIGCVQIVSGFHLNSLNWPTGDEENLLYIVIVGPEASNHGGEDGFTNEGNMTIINHSWLTDGSSSGISIRWDRRADSIDFGKVTLARAKGGVFLIKLANNGGMDVQQFPNLDPSGGPHQLLQYLRMKLPNDSVLASVKSLNDPRK